MGQGKQRGFFRGTDKRSFYFGMVAAALIRFLFDMGIAFSEGRWP